MSTYTAYPLTWPPGWKRTDYYGVQRSRYGDHSLAEARNVVTHEVRLMGGRDLVISSNLELRNDGLPRSGRPQPKDKGVAIYFEYKKKPMCFACDKWGAVEDNLWAIGKTIGAIRQIERAGSSDMMERAFTGFAALPAPAGSNWWEVLGISPRATQEEIRDAYRELARQNHPDAGGDHEKFIVIKAAYETAMSQ
jgi:DnaJ-like protein